MSSPVTVAVRREADPARIDETIEWIDRGLEMARRFDGCLGGGVMRDAAHANVLHVVYRFTDERALARWERSEQRREWASAGAKLVSSAAVQRRTGIEGWFDGPQLRRAFDTRTGTMRTIGVRAAPPRWKQAVTIWLGMLPLNFAVSMLVTNFPWWHDLPLLLRSVLLVTAMVPLMTFAVMPAITRVLRSWLRRNSGVIRSERALHEALDARVR